MVTEGSGRAGYLNPFSRVEKASLSCKKKKKLLPLEGGMQRPNDGSRVFFFFLCV